MTQSLNSTFTVFILLATITRLFPKLLLQACVVLLWASWPLALHTLVRIHGTCQIISIIEKVDQLAQSFNFPVSVNTFYCSTIISKANFFYRKYEFLFPILISNPISQFQKKNFKCKSLLCFWSQKRVKSTLVKERKERI